jgi:hypothetical protein
MDGGLVEGKYKNGRCQQKLETLAVDRSALLAFLHAGAGSASLQAATVAAVPRWVRKIA